MTQVRMDVARSIPADDSRGERNKKPGPQRPRYSNDKDRLLHVQVDVVNHKRSLQTGIFSTSETDLNRLSLERKHAERMLLVSAGVVQIGESTESGQHGSTGVEHLHLQGVKGSG